MHNPRHFAALIIVALTVVFATSSNLLAESLGSKSSVGARVGAYINNGDDGPLVIPGVSSQDISGGSLYAEFFYSYTASQFLGLEIAMGISSRGKLQHSVDNLGDVILEPINIYPIQLSGKLYPFGDIVSRKVKPYGQAGLALIYGTQKLTRSYAYDSNTKADVSFMLGGGVDVALTRKIGLNFSSKYIAVDYGSDGFYNINDFSGFTVMAGLFYTGASSAESEN